MTRKSKNKFQINGDTITIMRDDWKSCAYATYREDYYEQMTTHTWNIDSNGYPYNKVLGGGLHRYMMSKWYGENVLRRFTEEGYVVDHLNNDHMDCRITNLEFLKHNRNVAKGIYLDKEADTIRHRLAVCIYKDFATGCYQIAMGCNDNIACKDGRGKLHRINTIHLLYDCEYPTVILDAEYIITQYEDTGSFSLKNLHWCDKRIQEAPSIVLSEEEKNQVFVNRNGIEYLVIGNGHTFLERVHCEEGWKPPECK